MNEEITASECAPRRGRTVGLSMFVAGLVAGVTVAAFGVAGAQTTTPDPVVPPTATDKPMMERGGHGLGGRGIHGEFTVANADGAYRRIATQKGEVTSVSATSITVKSVDGFARTYVVDADTKIHSENVKISDITKGEQVRIAGVIEGTTVRALKIGDGSATKMEGFRKRHRDRLEKETPDAVPSTSNTSA